MESERYKAEFEGKTFIIEQDSLEVGWYLYVYENRRNTYDYLQDTREAAMSQAKEGFGVPVEKWIEVKRKEDP